MATMPLEWHKANLRDRLNEGTQLHAELRELESRSTELRKQIDLLVRQVIKAEQEGLTEFDAETFGDREED